MEVMDIGDTTRPQDVRPNLVCRIVAVVPQPLRPSAALIGSTGERKLGEK